MKLCLWMTTPGQRILLTWHLEYNDVRGTDCRRLAEPPERRQKEGRRWEVTEDTEGF